MSNFVSGVVTSVTLVKDDGRREPLSFTVEDGVLVITSPPVCVNPEQTFTVDICADDEEGDSPLP